MGSTPIRCAMLGPMWKFGVYADWDSFFIGGKPGRWVGVHVDHPWTDDVKNYGCPYGVYLHWWPGKCKSWVLSTPRTQKIGEDLWAGAVPTKIVRRCSVCKSEEVAGTIWLSQRIHKRSGEDWDGGSSMHNLCEKHLDLAEQHGLRVKLVDPTPKLPTYPPPIELIRDEEEEALWDHPWGQGGP